MRVWTTLHSSPVKVSFPYTSPLFLLFITPAFSSHFPERGEICNLHYCQQLKITSTQPPPSLVYQVRFYSFQYGHHTHSDFWTWCKLRQKTTLVKGGIDFDEHYCHAWVHRSICVCVCVQRKEPFVLFTQWWWRLSVCVCMWSNAVLHLSTMLIFLAAQLPVDAVVCERRSWQILFDWTKERNKAKTMSNTTLKVLSFSKRCKAHSKPFLVQNLSSSFTP